MGQGDQIYVTDGVKSNTFTVSDESAGTNKGRFTEDSPSYSITGDIEAFYPASLKTDNGYVWPAVQNNRQVAPMYAKQAISGVGDETVSFSSLGSIISSSQNFHFSNTLKPGSHVGSGPFFESELNRLTHLTISGHRYATKPPIHIRFEVPEKKNLLQSILITQ